jgi:hypothetical protein
LPRLGICKRHPYIEIAAPGKIVSLHNWNMSKEHTGPWFSCDFQNSVHNFITKLCRQKSYKIIIIKIFCKEDKGKPNIEYIFLRNFGMDPRNYTAQNNLIIHTAVRNSVISNVSEIMKNSTNGPQIVLPTLSVKGAYH